MDSATVQTPAPYSQMIGATEGAEKASAPHSLVMNFLASKTLDEFAEKAMPIVSDIVEALRSGKPVPHQNFGMNMLHWAVVAGDVEALEEMIRLTTHEQFVDLINQPNDALSVKNASYEGALGRLCPAINNDTPLGVALFVENKITGREGFAKVLMSHLQSGDLRIQDPNKDLINNTGNSLLNQAAGGCRRQGVEQLSGLLGAESMAGLINRQTSPGGSTPVNHSATSGFRDTMEWLFENGALDSLSTADAGGKTPLHNAALTGRREVLECLLVHGAQCCLSLHDNYGRSPLDCLNERIGKIEKSIDKKEADEWKILLDKLDPQLQAAEPDLSPDMNALKV